MQSTFRPLPLAEWGKPFTPDAERRSRYTFKAGYDNTLNLLDRELWHLGAESFVIEAAFREVDIRVTDGLPKSNARVPEFPGVRIAFDSVHGPLIYQTDTCQTWQHNLRSIALGLEALRAVDRHGISSRAEQYTGFKAIGAGMAMPAGGWMSKERATEIVYKHSRSDKSTPLADAWKFARRRSHPDP